MSDEQDTENRDDATLATLLHLAGPAAPISPDIEQRVYNRVRDEWRRSARQAPARTRQSALRWMVPFAMAASVLVAVMLFRTDSGAPARSIGSVLADGRSVSIGELIDTSDASGLSIWLDGDISLRVDADTRLEFVAANEVSLQSGRVYVDTGDRIYSDRHITIATATGKATDIGTQFAVSYDNNSMGVAVREGRVDLSAAQQTYSAVRGQQIIVRQGEAAEVQQIPVSGADWEWVVALAPEFDLEQHSVLDFLKWASRETGLELVFHDDDVRSAARLARAHGSISGLTPLEAVEAVLATTQFKYTIDTQSLMIDK